MTEIFDAHLRSDACDDDDLRNLRYFETVEVVTTAHARRPFERAEDLLAYLDELRGAEAARLRRCGLTPHVALGVPPDARPRRAHPEVFEALPAMLDDEVVAAVGEIGAWEDSAAHWRLFERQVAMAAARPPMPLVITPPRDLRVNMTYKMMRRLEHLDFPPERALFNYLDARLVENVHLEGFVAGITVDPTALPPRRAARLAADALEALGDDRRLVLSSGLRAGAADVLALPKTLDALTRLGVPDPTITRLAHTNARELYAR